MRRLLERFRSEGNGKGTGRREEIQSRIDSVSHWYHRIEVAPGIVTPGTHNSQLAIRQVALPDDMSGLRVLDVGARDGFFSFEAEKRGAEVLAIDSVASDLTGFSVASELLGSHVEWRTMNVYDITPERVGTFDVIIFLGVLYHLRDPMRALDALWEVSRANGRIWMNSHVIDNALIDPETREDRRLVDLHPDLANIPLAQFYPHGELGSNLTNCWGPNLAGLRGMLESAGFAVERSELFGRRGLVVGSKIEDAEIKQSHLQDRTTTDDRRNQPV